MRRTLGIIGMIFLLSQMAFTQNRTKLLYFGDPMCSWCYGFSPELSTALEILGDKVELQLIMGGLRPNGQETMASLKDFLKEHWEHVHAASGQPFKYDILDQSDFIYDTEPACRAVVTMRKFNSQQTFEFFKDVQIAFYAENKNTTRSELYHKLAEKYGIDGIAFLESFQSEAMRNLVQADFSFSNNLGVRGFPTVVLQLEGTYHMIANGYVKSQVIVERVVELLAKTSN